MIKSAIGKARATKRTAEFAAYSVTMVNTATLVMRKHKGARRHEIWLDWKKRWAKGVCSIFGLETTIEWDWKPPDDGARLYVANHRSPMDIPLMVMVSAGAPLSRHDIAEWPVFGQTARFGKTIFVDREDKRSGAQAIRSIRRWLEEGISVIVFPEGGTFPGDEVVEFKAGAFAAARGLGVEVVPVGICYPLGAEFMDETFIEHLMRMAARKKTPCRMVVGEPLPPVTNTRKSAKAAQDAVQGLVRRARDLMRSPRAR